MNRKLPGQWRLVAVKCDDGTLDYVSNIEATEDPKTGQSQAVVSFSVNNQADGMPIPRENVVKIAALVGKYYIGMLENQGLVIESPVEWIDTHVKIFKINLYLKN